MKPERESLKELLDRVEKVEVDSICNKLRAIIAFTDPYVAEMTGKPKDEFLYHVAELRAQASTLLIECDKVSNNGLLTRIKKEYDDLASFVEYLFMLRGEEMVEQAHEAL